VDEHTAPIRLPKAQPASPPLITMDRASVGYETGKPILSGLSLRLDPDDRIALLGKNGNGKSTFAKLLAGRLEAMGGDFVRARKLVPGYFAQHQLDELDARLTPLEILGHLRPSLVMQEMRNQLGGFGFSADKANTKVANLSGGERARLMLALITLDKPNMLILDEPTNHLDIDARSELLKALTDFNGAVVLVSHDRRLVEGTADRLFLVSDGQVAPFDGDLDDYRKYLLSNNGSSSSRETAENRKSKDATRRQGAARRQQLKPLKDKVDTFERGMAKLTADIRKYDAELAKPDLFARDAAKAAEIAKHRADAARELAVAEEGWLAAHEAYERANGE
jgi:ATP-binding cassette, subfamily F, member 3